MQYRHRTPSLCVLALCEIEGGNCYSAHEIAWKAANIIRTHPQDPEAPLFMYMALQSVHTPLEAPQMYVDKYDWMKSTNYTPVNENRQLYGGMVDALDEAVANVTKALVSKDSDGTFWNNTLVVFTTDNGGVGAGNNYPLRGRKATLWEGGTRAVGFIRGPGVPANSTSLAMMHAVDWMPTLLAAAGPPINATTEKDDSLDGIDGLNLWPALTGANTSSPRSEFVYNIEPNEGGVHAKGMKCGAVRVNCFKLIKGDPGSGTYDPKPQPRPACKGGETPQPDDHPQCVRCSDQLAPAPSIRPCSTYNFFLC